jgi:hypothetical protein
MLQHKQTNRRFPAPRYMLPTDTREDEAGLQHLHTAVERLKDRNANFKDHPVFGQLTPDQWKHVHLWHSEHHLSYLNPKTAVSTG